MLNGQKKKKTNETQIQGFMKTNSKKTEQNFLIKLKTRKQLTERQQRQAKDSVVSLIRVANTID